MASIKLKFRPSSVKGKKGVLSYQIIHYRLTRLIKTSYRIMPSEWDDSTGSLLISTQSECKARLLLIRDQTNWEMTRLQGIINDLERTGVEYTIDDIVASFRKIPSVESVFNFMQRCINKLERQKRGLASSQALEDGTEGRQTHATALLTDCIATSTQTTTTPVTIHLNNDGKNWRITKSDEITTALLGNLEEALTTILTQPES